MIKKGDLVMVVKGPKCGCPSMVVGAIGVVDRIAECLTKYQSTCGHETYGNIAANFNGICVELPRIKKIDPPSTGELKGVPLRMKEPA